MIVVMIGEDKDAIGDPWAMGLICTVGWDEGLPKELLLKMHSNEQTRSGHMNVVRNTEICKTTTGGVNMAKDV